MTLDTMLPPGVLDADAGEISPERSCRYLLDATAAGGRLSLMELFLPPRTLGAPLHRHTREDEFTYVTRGRIAALLGDVVVEAGPGDLILKPSGQWHTFWNPGDEPAAALEIDSPGGLEGMFREMDALGEDLDDEAMVALTARYGCELDMAGTAALVERHGLAF